MYFSLNNEKIVFHQTTGITVRINGPEDLYYVEVREFKNNHESYFLEGYQVSLEKKEGVETEFNFPILFYADLETSIYKFTGSKRATKIFTHRYNDYGKLVKFKFDSDNYKECDIWYEKVMEYSFLKGCKPVIDSPFDEINKKVPSFYEIIDIDYYKTYYLGRYPKTDSWKPRQTLDEAILREKNVIDYWSLHHPRNPENLTSEQIASDILGI